MENMVLEQMVNNTDPEGPGPLMMAMKEMVLLHLVQKRMPLENMENMDIQNMVLEQIVVENIALEKTVMKKNGPMRDGPMKDDEKAMVLDGMVMKRGIPKRTAGILQKGFLSTRPEIIERRWISWRKAADSVPATRLPDYNSKSHDEQSSRINVRV